MANGEVRPFWSQMWDAIFDADDYLQVNSPEGLGPILHEHLGLPGARRRP